MNKTTEALKLAEEIFSGMLHGTDWNNGTHANIYRPKFPKVLAAIRSALADNVASGNEALAEPVKQEPVAWIHRYKTGAEQINTAPPETYVDWTHEPLYTTPPTAALAARQMRDAAVKVCRDKAEAMAVFGSDCNPDDLADKIAALPIEPIQWRDLTDEEIKAAYESWWEEHGNHAFPIWVGAKAVIAKFKEVNGA